MSNAVEVFDIQAFRIARGVSAWNRIKATAAEQRDLWRAVGEALLEGRKLHPSNQKFGQWCKEVGFEDLPPDSRTAAMWWADVSRNDCGTAPPRDLTHPVALRTWHREQAQEALLPEDLKSLEPTPSAPSLPPEDAEKVVKLIHRSRTGDEGSPIAQRMVKGLAKRHDMTEEQLEEAAKNGAPDSYFRFAPPVQQSLNDFRTGLRSAVRNMLDDSVPLEAVKAILIQLANTL